VVSLPVKRQKVRSTGQILKIEINFQSEAKQQHDTSNEIETYTGNSKAGNSPMSSCHLQAEAEAAEQINSKLVVPGQSDKTES
jgi:hypothetical protein